MESITFRQCVKGAWQDTWRVTRERPTMVLVFFAVFLAVYDVQLHMQFAVVRAAAAGEAHAAAPLASRLFVLLQWLTIAVLSVQVMRHALLGCEAARLSGFFDRDFWRYLGVGTVMMGLAVAVGALVVGVVAFLMPKAHVILALVMGGAVCAALFMFVRLSLLFCHVATGGRICWRAAWDDTHGHFWNMSLTHVVAALPMFGVGLVLLIVENIALSIAGLEGAPALLAFGNAFWSVVGGMLGSACSVWLYRRYAERMLR